MSGFVVAMQVGMWFGYVTFGYVADRLGPEAHVCPVSYRRGGAHRGVRIGAGSGRAVAVGPFVAFFATGYFGGFGAVTAEIYPTTIRATAQGVSHNIGRVASAVAPFAVGRLAETRGFGVSLLMCSAASLAATFWLWIPETKGQELR